jgi:hypothetical protein
VSESDFYHIFYKSEVSMVSRIRVSKILRTLSERDAKDFLEDLANLQEDDFKAVKRLRKTFPEMFHRHVNDGAVFIYAKYLRRAWDAPDQRHREWYLFALRQMHAKEREAHGVEVEEGVTSTVQPGTAITPGLLGPPPETSHMECALWYLQEKVRDKAKRCAREDCRRYFIAQKRWNKFCSQECAAIRTRENKRLWAADKREKGEL